MKNIRPAAWGRWSSAGNVWGLRALAWEGGVIFGMVNDTANYTFRLSLEFEF